MSAAAPSVPAIRLVGIDKRFGVIRALAGVELELVAGEVHALVGENGAGKSTLIKVLSGAHAPDAGVIEVRGARLASLTPASARELGIAVLYQHETVFEELSVAENLFFGRDGARIAWPARRARAVELLASLECSFDVETRVAALSPAQKKELELARALSAGAPVLVLDEPTAVLPAREAERLLATVAKLRARGVAVLYISHRLEELERIADRITVLRDGRTVWSGDARAVTRAELVRHMVGREVAAPAPAPGASAGRAASLVVRALGAAHLGLLGISFTLHAGEVLGLGGLVGAGRSELARCLFGLEPFEAGALELDGRPFAPRSPRAALAAGLAYVPEDRGRDGLVLAESVRANAALPWLARLARGGLVRAQAEHALAESVVRDSAVRATLDARAGTLSGGNQQKLALGRTLVERPRVLILDEPTQGIDVAGRAELHARIRALAAEGVAILLISSDHEELLALAERVLVLRRGRVAGELGGSALTKERLLALALGLTETQA